MPLDDDISDPRPLCDGRPNWLVRLPAGQKRSRIAPQLLLRSIDRRLKNLFRQGRKNVRLQRQRNSRSRQKSWQIRTKVQKRNRKNRNSNLNRNLRRDTVRQLCAHVREAARRGDAEKMLGRLRDPKMERCVPESCLNPVHVGLGEKEKILDYLQKSYAECGTWPRCLRHKFQFSD